MNLQTKLKTIGVIGAGAAGREIARAALLAGYRTIIEDVSVGTVEQGAALIDRSLDEEVARGLLAPRDKRSAMALLSTACRVDEVCRVADLLIETVPEEMEVKLEIFTIFDKFAKPDAILASTTSLSISEIATITFRTENCVAMHFVDRVPGKRLLEIVRGTDTSDETVAACVELGQRMGREIAVLREPEESGAGSADSSAPVKGHSQ